MLKQQARLLNATLFVVDLALVAAAALAAYWLRSTALPALLRGIGVDPPRTVALLGHSAGGHLVLWLASEGLGLAVDVVVALDASKSMLARDVQPSRIDRARLELTTLLDDLKGDRVGIVVFAGDAFVQCPLTSDYAAAKMFLRAVDPEQMPQGGTNIGAALVLARQVFENADRGAKEKVVVLISDGYENDPPFGVREVTRVFRERLDPESRVSFVHLNPVFDSERFMPRSLGPEVPTVGLREAEDLPTVLSFARFAQGDAPLAELEAYLEGRVREMLAHPAREGS